MSFRQQQRGSTTGVTVFPFKAECQYFVQAGMNNGVGTDLRRDGSFLIISGVAGRREARKQSVLKLREPALAVYLVTDSQRRLVHRRTGLTRPRRDENHSSGILSLCTKRHFCGSTTSDSSAQAHS